MKKSFFLLSILFFYLGTQAQINTGQAQVLKPYDATKYSRPRANQYTRKKKNSSAQDNTQLSKKEEYEIGKSLCYDIFEDCIATITKISELDNGYTITATLPEGYGIFEFRKSVRKIFDKYEGIDVLFPWTGSETNKNESGSYSYLNSYILMFYYLDENTVLISIE